MIKECALQFRKLLPYEINICMRKKHVYTKMTINFSDNDFYHLSGLHKLSDIRLVGSKKKVFNDILVDDKLCEKIDGSKDIGKINDRVELVKSLKYIFKHKMEIYPYKRNSNKWSLIKADYLMKFYFKGNQCYLFLCEHNDKYYVCASIIKDKQDFTLYLKKYEIVSTYIGRKTDEPTPTE